MDDDMMTNDSELTVRPVHSGDIAAITRIYNGYILSSTATFETEPVTEPDMEHRVAMVGAAGGTWLVCDDHGVVVGYSYSHPWKERAAYAHTFETTVYVDPEHHGRGIGTALMQALISSCRSAGVHALVACITAENVRSISLHERLGFRRVSSFSEVGRKFGRWLGVVDCELLLG